MTDKVLDIDTGGAPPDVSEISSDWFGAIQTGYKHVSGFEHAADKIGIGMLRWPGGTLSETRPEVYGLDIPGLFDATDLWAHNPDRKRPDLQDSLTYAVEQGISFSLIIPTARYTNDLATGETQLIAFLEDLFQGQYGPLPPSLTLELGNEYYALEEFENDPSAYGAVASRFSELINEVAQQYLSPVDQEKLDIAVQMGRSSADNADILGAFSNDALAATTSLVFHSLPISLNNLNRTHEDRDGLTRYEAAEQQYQAWKTAIEAAGGTTGPQLFLSAWAVGGSGGELEDIDLVWHEYGSRSIAMVLDTFAGYASIGVDAAAVWGLNSDHLNRVSSAEGANSQLTHIGELLKLMSVSLPGQKFQGMFTPKSRDDDTMVWSFGNDGTFTTYVAINELTGSNDVHNLAYDGISNFQLVSANLLSSELEDGYTGTFSSADASLYEVAVVQTLQYEFSDSGIRFSFGLGYEAAEISISQNAGTTGSTGHDWISGTSNNDLIEGFDGNDFLLGSDGRDTIDGGSGDDEINGGNGGDLIFGDGSDEDALADYLLFLTQSDEATAEGLEGNFSLTAAETNRLDATSSEHADLVSDMADNIA